MRKTWPKTSGVVIRGRTLLQDELVLIRKLIRDNPTWGRTRISEAVCRALDWRQPNGRLKDRGCRVALLKLEMLGFLSLPPKKIDRGGQPPHIETNSNLDQTEIRQMPQVLELRLVESVRDSRLWNSLIANHHYLGLATPVGRLVRYLILGDGAILGAISFSDAAWSINGRDELLLEFGLNRQEIRSAVVSNNRFLILPHVQVRNLASRVLALATSQLLLDWKAKFMSTPQFFETFVDPRRFEGTCYRAANWTLVGKTKGFAKHGATHRNERLPKLLFMLGIGYNCQRFLRERFLEPSHRAA
ncbi:Druantia anti-phage system protein DruA [Schlesneria sp. DSM 10557]|uniref:Druantia anti-phage system protein DruA n=1 Tax=Schlesneria sp. DSM 10557 TaxID=3044399 RepID=UPI00359F89A0